MRIGFVVHSAGASWLGGVSYFANLFAALEATPETGIDPLVYSGGGLRLPPGWEHRERRLPILRAGSPAFYARGLIFRLLGADLLLQRRLRAAGVDLISHGGVGRSPSIPALPWVADLQHRRLPGMFSAYELWERDRSLAQMIRFASLLLTSSEAARQDVEEFFPAARGRVRVLRFVHCSSDADPAGAAGPHVDPPERFFLLPNQFWIHKNHSVVIDALQILRERRRKIVVVCTGHTHDYRQPSHFPALQKRIREAGVSDQLRILGVVPYRELASLQRRSVAVINPSLFEGWSTTVEEAKSLGKRAVLSAIPTHLEQAPERGVYFDPHEAGALADALLQVWDSFDPTVEIAAAERATRALPGRRRAFAETYAAVAREAIRLGPRRD